MNNNHKQDSLKDMIDLLKQDYKSPTKMWIWAVALKEWAAHLRFFEAMARMGLPSEAA